MAPRKGKPEEAISAFLDEVVALFRSCREEGLFERDPAIATAGGSAFYDIAIERLQGAGATVMTRSGCYVSHDSGLYEAQQRRILDATGQAEGLINALEVWAYVQSRPEPGLAILTAGRRDAGTDAGLPVPLLLSRDGGRPMPLAGCEMFAINDQHAYLRCPPELDLRIGDRIGLGVSHPCTTFDKWDLLYLVDDEYNVIGGLKTFF
jgi:D-serine dehydratase